MALLPLADPPAAGLPIDMSTNDRKSPAISQVQRITRAVSDLFEEWNYAQKRVLELRLIGPDPNCAPRTYGEFLARSPFALWREPSAKHRRTGAHPRR
jgi:hypothetical protein